ncbi:MAG: hypothetical protein FWE42_04530 [Defluviitaleaceae bacterium]|nr:hypothetical protein [Defluviitaleaceae bacterium]
MNTKNHKAGTANSISWRRVLMLFFILLVIAGIAVFAYDNTDYFPGQFEYSEYGYIGDAPYEYQPYNADAHSLADDDWYYDEYHEYHDWYYDDDYYEYFEYYDGYIGDAPYMQYGEDYYHYDEYSGYHEDGYSYQYLTDEEYARLVESWLTRNQPEVVSFAPASAAITRPIPPPQTGSIPITNRTDLLAFIARTGIFADNAGYYHLEPDPAGLGVVACPIYSGHYMITLTATTQGRPEIFTGVLDGQGHTIGGLRLRPPTVASPPGGWGNINNTSAGLIRIAGAGATIKHLNLHSTHDNIYRPAVTTSGAPSSAALTPLASTAAYVEFITGGQLSAVPAGTATNAGWVNNQSRAGMFIGRVVGPDVTLYNVHLGGVTAMVHARHTNSSGGNLRTRVGGFVGEVRASGSLTIRDVSSNALGIFSAHGQLHTAAGVVGVSLGTINMYSTDPYQRNEIRVNIASRLMPAGSALGRCGNGWHNFIVAGGVLGRMEGGNATIRDTNVASWNTRTITDTLSRTEDSRMHWGIRASHFSGGIVGWTSRAGNLAIYDVTVGVNTNTWNVDTYEYTSISGNRAAGGIVGHSGSNMRITRAHNMAQIITSSISTTRAANPREGTGGHIGGIVGVVQPFRNSTTRITDVVNEGPVGHRNTQLGYTIRGTTPPTGNDLIRVRANRAGGIVGDIRNASRASIIIDDARNYGNIRGHRGSVGGIVGRSDIAVGQITRSLNHGTVWNSQVGTGAGTSGSASVGANGRWAVGGIVGLVNRNGLVISESGNTGHVFTAAGPTGTNSHARRTGIGGIVGRNVGRLTIERSFNQGFVNSASRRTGGIVGQNFNGNLTLLDVYNSGSVLSTATGANNSNAGAGILGERRLGSIRIQRAYVSANVSGAAVAQSNHPATGAPATAGITFLQVYVDRTTAGARATHGPASALLQGARPGINVIDTELLTSGLMPGINRGPWRWQLADHSGNPLPMDPTYHEGAGWEWSGKRALPYFDWQVCQCYGRVCTNHCLETIFFYQIISTTVNQPPLDLNIDGNNTPHTIQFTSVDNSTRRPYIRTFDPYYGGLSTTLIGTTADASTTGGAATSTFSARGDFTHRPGGTSTLNNIPGDRYVSVGLISENNVVGFTMNIPPERFAVMAYDPEVGFQRDGQIDWARITGVNVTPTLGLYTLSTVIDHPGVDGHRSTIEGIFLGEREGALGYENHYPDNTWVQIEAVGYHTIIRRDLTWDEIESREIWVPMVRAPINLIIRTYYDHVEVTGTGDAQVENVVRRALTNSWVQHAGREVVSSNLPAGNPFITLNAPRSFRLPFHIEGISDAAREQMIRVFDPIRVGAPGFATMIDVVNPMNFERDEITGEFRTTVIDGRTYYLLAVVTENITRERAYIRMIDNDMVEDGEVVTGDPWYFFERDNPAEHPLEFRYSITAAGTQWAPSVLVLPLQRTVAGVPDQNPGPGGTNPAGVAFNAAVPSAVAANNLTMIGNPATPAGGHFNSLNIPATAPSVGAANFRVHIIEPTRSIVSAFRPASYGTANLTGDYIAMEQHRLINGRDIGLARATEETFFWVECLRGVFLPSDILILGDELGGIDDYEDFGQVNRTDVARQVRDRVNVPMRRPVDPIEIFVRVLLGPTGEVPFPYPEELLVTAGLLPSAVMLAPVGNSVFRLFAESSPDFCPYLNPNEIHRTIFAQAHNFITDQSYVIDYRNFSGTYRYITLRMIPQEYILEATVNVPDGFPITNVNVTLSYDYCMVTDLNPPGVNVGNVWTRRTTRLNDGQDHTDHGSPTVGFVLARPVGQVSGQQSDELVRPDGYHFTHASYIGPASEDAYGNQWARRTLNLTPIPLDERGGIHGIVWHHSLPPCECAAIIGCTDVFCPTRPPETEGPLATLSTATITKICPNGTIATRTTNDPRWMAGYYEFLNQESGYYTLIVSAPGYVTQVRENVRVDDGYMAVEDFIMRRVDTPPPYNYSYTLIITVQPNDAPSVALTLDGLALSAGGATVHALPNNMWVVINNTSMTGRSVTATSPLFTPESVYVGAHDPIARIANVIIRLDSAPLVFYKTDMGIYYPHNPTEINFLQGAVFQLYRRERVSCGNYPGCSTCDCGLCDDFPGCHDCDVCARCEYYLDTCPGFPNCIVGICNICDIWPDCYGCDVCILDFDCPDCPPCEDCYWIWVPVPLRQWEPVECTDCTDTTECPNYDSCRYGWVDARWWYRVSCTLCVICEDCEDCIKCEGCAICDECDECDTCINHDDCRWDWVWYSAVSDSNGQVRLNITGALYRLIEVRAPRSPQHYREPDGHWYIQRGAGRAYFLPGDITTAQNTENDLPIGRPVPEFIQVQRPGDEGLENILAVGNELAFIDFTFYKTNERLYEATPVINMRDGAEFFLYRQVWDEESDEYIWVPVLVNPFVPGSGQVEVISGDGASTPAGQVSFSLTYNGVYKIREEAPPPAPTPYNHTYMQPPGYWVITMRHGVIVPTRINNADVYIVPSAPDNYRIPPFVLYNDDWHVGNLREWLFEFHSTDERLYSWPAGEGPEDWLLAGVHFRLFRFIGDDQPGDDELVISGIATNVGTRWEEVTLVDDESTGDIDYPLWYYIDPRFTYQLVQVNQPARFQPPWGQWRIWVGQAPTPDNTGPLGIRIDTIGHIHLTPCFVSDDGVLFVGNMEAFELPVAGGTGTTLFIAAGITLLSSASVLIIIFFIARKRKQNYVCM